MIILFQLIILFLTDHLVSTDCLVLLDDHLVSIETMSGKAPDQVDQESKPGSTNPFRSWHLDFLARVANVNKQVCFLLSEIAGVNNWLFSVCKLYSE